MIHALPLLLLALAAADGSALKDASGSSTPENRAEPTEARRLRGQYLVEGILWCFQCHSELDYAAAGHPPKPGREGVGRVYAESDDGRLVSPNLTPDEKTGIGRFSDVQLDRAIRQGIGHDGRQLRAMPAANGFNNLSDEDLASVIVYLRSRAPVRNQLPATEPAGEPSAERAASPLISVASRDLSSVVARGTYLIELADCIGCHTAWPAPRMPGVLVGGNPMQDEPGIFSSNLTIDGTGIGYGTDAFVQVMKTGKSGTLSAQMPWASFRNLSETDLRAIYAALATLPPVQHLVNNLAEPSFCEVCGQRHGGGSVNRLVLPEALVRLDSTVLERYVGTYQSPRLGISVEISLDDGALHGRAGPWSFSLVAQNNSRFLAPGFPSSIRFEGAESGPASRLISVDLTEIVFERIVEK